MPNWCFTRITINSDHNRLKAFEKRLTEWTSKAYKKNDFGLSWLGNVVGNSQIGTVGEDKETDLKCRGYITYIDNTGDQLTINTETAWVPMLKMWVKLVEKYMPNAELIYDAEESGNGLFCTNDPQYRDKYIIDSWDVDDVETDYEASTADVVSVLQRLLDTAVDDVDRLIQMFERSDYTEHMAIHSYEFIEASEWD